MVCYKKELGIKFPTLDFTQVPDDVINSDMITVSCEKHGAFDINVGSIRRSKHGCPQCAKEATRRKLSKTTDDFIRSARKIHGELFDYSKSVYKNSHTPLTVVCKTHGEFTITPDSHINAKNKGCVKCNSYTTDEFIQKANRVHDNLYGYTHVSYNGIHDKIKIECNTHGIFEQKAGHHLAGSGCPKCARVRYDYQHYVELAKSTHGDSYEYLDNENFHNDRKLHIVCPIHGMFSMIYYNHIGNACKCPKCSFNIKSIDGLESSFNTLYNGKYQYDFSNYENVNSKISITCSEHGEYFTSAYNHLNGVECPCCSPCSKPQNELFIWLKDNIPDGEWVQNTRSIITPLEIDIYSPVYKLAIEYNGLYWHSSSCESDENPLYHRTKTNMCLDAGIRLLHIFDYTDMNIWKSVIKKHCNVAERLESGTICTVDETLKKSFLIKNHPYGDISSDVNIGMFVDTELVSIMILRDNTIVRYASKLGHRIVNDYDDMIDYYIKLYDTIPFIMIDLSWELLETDARFCYEIYPTDKWFKSDEICVDDNPGKMYQQGYRRFWDCGYKVYELTPERT